MLLTCCTWNSCFHNPPCEVSQVEEFVANTIVSQVTFSEIVPFLFLVRLAPGFMSCKVDRVGN